MSPTNPEQLLDRAASRLGRLQAPCVRLFGENGDLKVLSVLLAALLFFLIRPFAADSTKTFSVPVRVASSNKAVTVVDYAPRTVSVTLHGRQNQVNSFDPSQLAMELEEAFPEEEVETAFANGEGYIRRPIVPRMLQGNGDLRFLSCQSDAVRIQVDYTGKWETENLVAVPSLVGRPVEGGTATVRLDDPVAVVVKGSIRRLNDFRDRGLLLPTEPIDVEGKTTSFSQKVAIKIPADSGITSVEPAVVTAWVDIAIAVTNRTETAAPVLLKDAEPAPAKAEEAEEGEKAEEVMPDDAESTADDAEPATEDAEPAAQDAASADEGAASSDEPAAEPSATGTDADAPSATPQSPPI